MCDLLEAVNKTVELSSSFSITDISSKSGSCEIKWVDETEGGSTGSTTGGHVTHEELDWLGLWVEWAEILLVGILAGEVESLSWEITDDVSQVTSPEGHNTLLRCDSGEAVTDTSVLLILGDIWVSILHLKQKLDSLNWGHNSLGDGSGDTTGKEVHGE